MLPAQPNQSLLGGFECLQVVMGADRPMGSREVARILGLEHTRVNRLLGTLAHIGVLQKTEGRKYMPGSGIHVLAAQSLRSSGLLRKAMAHIDPLRDLGLAVALGVLWRDQICYLIHIKPGANPADGIGSHQLYPAIDSSIGHCVLAEMKKDEVNATLPDLPDDARKALHEKLAAVRQQGYALLRPEGPSTSLAVLMGNPKNVALAVAGKITTRMVPRTVDLLRAVSDRICAD